MNRETVYPEVHLGNMGSRFTNTYRGYPLIEKWSNCIKSMDRNNTASLLSWLDVENSKRYKPEGKATFCNIYAYDYCYQTNNYLPHIWWKSDAIKKMDNKLKVNMDYPFNVKELNANATFDWLKDYSHLYGWVKVKEEEDAQDLVSKGKVGVVCAKGKIGHITVIIPEWEDTLERANYQKDRTGRPLLLQSQAGYENKKSFSDRWYEEFKEYGFWVNIGEKVEI